MWFSRAIAKRLSRSRQKAGVGADTLPLVSIPGEVLSPLQLIQTRVQIMWDSLSSRKCARHQPASNLLPKSFHFFQGVFHGNPDLLSIHLKPVALYCDALRRS